MPASAAELLAATTVLVRRGPYALGAWPPVNRAVLLETLAALPPDHGFVNFDEREITVLVLEDRLETLPPPTAVEHGWAVLTLDTVMTWDVLGVLAGVSSAFAAAGVPLGAVSAFSRDHLLVQAPHLERAAAVLGVLCAEVRDLG